jgi:endonuclease/exonuclease/phosphatase family metal-dependent hydrolase
MPDSSMKLLSLNIQGLGGQAKKLALKRLMELHRLDVFFLQETMGKVVSLISELRKS